MRLTAELVGERVRGTILEHVGNTPLLPLRRIGRGLRGELWAKLESANPAGSVEDRAALWMGVPAEEEGRLRAGATNLHATSGKTGLPVAIVGPVLRHRVPVCLAVKVS